MAHCLNPLPRGCRAVEKRKGRRAPMPCRCPHPWPSSNTASFSRIHRMTRYQEPCHLCQGQGPSRAAPQPHHMSWETPEVWTEPWQPGPLQPQEPEQHTPLGSLANIRSFSHSQGCVGWWWLCSVHFNGASVIAAFKVIFRFLSILIRAPERKEKPYATFLNIALNE